MKLHRHSILMAAGFAFALAAQASPVKESASSIFKPTGKGVGELDIESMNQPGMAAKATAQRSTNLTFQGGPVMVAPTNLYYIWYGSGWDAASKSTLNNFGNNIGGSPYFNINTTYTDRLGAHVVNRVVLAGSTTNTGTLGTRLSDANIQSIVSGAITSGALPSDDNAVYFVLTDKSVTATSGFCTQYCGWHSYAKIGAKDIKYAFVGNAETQCPNACGVANPSPNGTPGADAMASVLAHELEETVTDPHINAWYSTSGGMENGDKCAWNFGATSTASNGARYNQTMGTMKYLIQQNWTLLPTQGCAQHYP